MSLLRANWRAWLLALPVLAFLGFFLCWPLAHVVERAFRDETGVTARYVLAIFGSPSQFDALLRSLAIAVLTTGLAFALSLPTALVFARCEFPGKTILSGALLLPMILPPFVGAVGMRILLARGGALTTLLDHLGVVDGPVDWLGACPLLSVAVLEALHLFPVFHLNLVAAFANVDPALEDAARNLGAGPWRVFRRVTLPLASPGVFAGGVLVFVWSFTEMGTPLVLGMRQVIPVMIYDGVSEIGTNPAGYALALLVLALTAAGFLLAKALGGRASSASVRVAALAAPRRLGGAALLAVYAGFAALIALAALPHLATVLLASGRVWCGTVLPEGLTADFFGQALDSQLTRAALLNSLALSLAASALDLLLGISIAWLCVRRRMAGSALLDAAAMLPLAVPGLVIAFGYMGCFPAAFPGGLLDPRAQPMPLLAVSYAVRRLPFMVRAASAGLEQVSATYEEAAANLGARPLRVAWRVTLPLVSANLLAGLVLCFAFSMLEVSDSLILAQSEAFYPITKAIYALMDGLEHGINVAAALGAWAMAMLGAALVCATALLGRRAGALFRAG